MNQLHENYLFKDDHEATFVERGELKIQTFVFEELNTMYLIFLTY